MMKKRLLGGLGCLLLVGAAAGAGRAAPVASYPLPEMLERADVVCVGSVRSIRPASAPESAASRDPKPAGPGPAIADVAVEDVLKGNLAQTELSVRFTGNPAPDAPGAADAASYAELIPGQRAVLFLKRPAGGGGWALSDPQAYPAPVMTIGSASLTADQEGLSPLRAVIVLVANSLPGLKKETQLINLDILQQSGFLLYNFTRYGLEELAKVRETPTALAQFEMKQVAPQMAKLIASQDQDIHTAAVLAAAGIQDPEVIPELARWAAGKDPAFVDASGVALSGYRAPAAVNALKELLKSNNPNVKVPAATALAAIDQDARDMGTG